MVVHPALRADLAVLWLRLMINAVCPFAQVYDLTALALALDRTRFLQPDTIDLGLSQLTHLLYYI